MSSSHLEEKFIALWARSHPDIVLTREYRFCPNRKFRADFAHPQSRVLVEIVGGIWTRKRTGHSTGTGIERDCLKIAIASSLEFVTFPLTATMIVPEWINAIARTIRLRCQL